MAFADHSIRAPLRDSVRVLGLYIRAQLLIAIILMALYAIGFAAARVPLWPLIAIVGGFSSFIPRVGSLIPLIVAILASVIAEHSLMWLLITLGVWVLIQAIEGFVLAPRLFGRPLGLKPLPVFFALLAGSLLFGPIGLLLAVPVLAVAAVWWRFFRAGKANARDRAT
jgi:predicted PurR-regulated permease PerM